MERMKKVFLITDSIVSPLGIGSATNYNHMLAGKSGISKIENERLSEKPFHAAIIGGIEAAERFTRFENIAVKCVMDAAKNINLPSSKTIFILSTTKGNVSLLGKSNQRVALHESTKQIANALGFEHYITISNACISGVMAILLAQRLLSTGKYDHAIVVGADELSKFIVSGFQSLYAISDQPCKPFDKDRSGVTLGEAAGAVILSARPELLEKDGLIEICGGAMSNDANHISGPSRTGLELASAIDVTLKRCGVSSQDIDFISAHGTATLYNDEMEAKAFDHADLNTVPLNSLKGFFGHTLGAAGVVETIITAQGMIRSETMPTAGFDSLGVSKDLNVVSKVNGKVQRYALKTASGFGGCNAAMLLHKIV
jgi:3-oxoacyl-[acyl-carrier-protein] synthase-1